MKKKNKIILSILCIIIITVLVGGVTYKKHLDKISEEKAIVELNLKIENAISDYKKYLEGYEDDINKCVFDDYQESYMVLCQYLESWYLENNLDKKIRVCTVPLYSEEKTIEKIFKIIMFN